MDECDIYSKDTNDYVDDDKQKGWELPHFVLGQEEQVAWVAISLHRSAAQIHPPAFDH